jgi:hypothetical protein
VVAISSLAPVSSAGASTSVGFKATFSPGALGDGATATGEFTFNGSDYFGRPEPLRGLVLHLPVGTGGSASGFGTCEVSTLELTGPTGCAPGSSAGPEGGIVSEVAFGSEIVPETAKVLAFFGAGETINFYAQGSSPVSLEFVMTASYRPDAAPYGRVLSINVPALETVPGGAHAIITSLTLTLGSSRRERSTEANSVTIPAECRAGGLDWLTSASFEDTSSTQATYRSPCPTGRALSPLLGQREAIGVVSGEVAVRAKGSTSLVPLTTRGTIPDGSEVDATDGRAVIAAATTVSGQSQSAEVYGGRSLINQDPALGQTDLTLSLPLAGCRRAAGSSSAASLARRRLGPRSRHLWVSEGGGDWGTSGRYVSTSVEGTSWLTEDQCIRSRVKVASGRVRVHDLIRNRSQTLSSGEVYTTGRRFKRRH